MLLRLSSSTYHAIPLDSDDFTQVRRNTARIRRQRSHARSLIQSTSIPGTPMPSIVEPVPEEDVEPTEEEADPNIDKGWAWVVMFASLAMIILVDGISFSFGSVLLTVLRKEFNEDRTRTSLVGSVMTGFYLGAGTT